MASESIPVPTSPTYPLINPERVVSESTPAPTSPTHQPSEGGFRKYPSTYITHISTPGFWKYPSTHITHTSTITGWFQIVPTHPHHPLVNPHRVASGSTPAPTSTTHQLPESGFRKYPCTHITHLSTLIGWFPKVSQHLHHPHINPQRMVSESIPAPTSPTYQPSEDSFWKYPSTYILHNSPKRFVTESTPVPTSPTYQPSEDGFWKYPSTYNLHISPKRFVTESTSLPTSPTYQPSPKVGFQKYPGTYITHISTQRGWLQNVPMHTHHSLINPQRVVSESTLVPTSYISAPRGWFTESTPVPYITLISTLRRWFLKVPIPTIIPQPSRCTRTLSGKRTKLKDRKLFWLSSLVVKYVADLKF